MDDHFHDECGVVAVIAPKTAKPSDQAARHAYLGLYALQHRGQEGAGLAVLEPRGTIRLHKKKGLVSEVFQERHISKLIGSSVIGHVRYSTQGGNTSENLQPISIECKFGAIAVAHNGNVPHAEALRRQLEEQGAIFQSTSDTELAVHLISHSKAGSLQAAIVEALQKLEAAYSYVILTSKGVVVARDAYGFRPLLLGKLGDFYVVASETTAFDLMGAKLVREVAPGEMIDFFNGEPNSQFPFAKKAEKRCIFEWVYFSRPDSMAGNGTIHEARVRLGEQLAKEAPAPGAELVIPVPDSGVGAAIGYARASGVAFDMGIIRNHYVHRTFIKPKQDERSLGVRIKLNPIENVIRGRSVVIIDDSLVRGTTSQKLVGLVREAGAKSIHVRISSPPVTGPCFFGIDTPRRSELLAAQHSIEEMCKFIGADTLKFLTVEGMRNAVSGVSGANGLCDACFTGDYPMKDHCRF